MADAFDTALSDIENQRRAAVAAIAANGSAGAQALADANSQIGTFRKAALDAALANAAKTGAPLAAQQELAGIIRNPYDLLSASTNQMAASNATRQAALAQAVPTYFSQVAAAVPIARNALKSRIDTINAEARAKAEAQQQSQLSDSELRVRLMGAGEGLKQQALGQVRDVRDVGREQRDSLRQRRDDLRHEIAVRIAEGRLKPGRGRQRTLDMQTLLAATKQQIGESKQGIRAAKREVRGLKADGTERFAREAGIQSGLDPDLVRGLIPITQKSQQEDNLDPASRFRAITDAARRVGLGSKVLARITRPSGPDENPTMFETAAKAAQDAIKSDVPLSVFKKDMNQYLPAKAKRTKALIIAIYGPGFRN